MNLWSVEHFLMKFVITFGWVCCCINPKLMTKMAKKCSTDQRFIRKRNTTYKIHTLVDLKIPPDPNDPLVWTRRICNDAGRNWRMEWGEYICTEFCRFLFGSLSHWPASNEARTWKINNRAWFLIFPVIFDNSCFVFWDSEKK